MTRLTWLTPDSIYLYYRSWGTRRSDGLSTCDFIAKWQQRIAYENGAFERSGTLAKDRWEYERKTKPMEILIRDAERDVVNLIKFEAERGGWIAFGRHHRDAEEEVIPSRAWPFLDLDIETRVATGHGITFRAVRGLIRRQIPSCHPIFGKIQNAEELSEARHDLARSHRRRSGRLPPPHCPILPNCTTMCLTVRLAPQKSKIPGAPKGARG